MRNEDLKKITVLGAGIMGSGIAEVCARGNYKVYMTDLTNELVSKGLGKIKTSLARAAEKGKITKENVETTLSNIKFTTDLREAVKDTDLVIEATPEDLELKKRVFKQLEELCPKHTILASNTSGIMITDIAAATNRPDKVIGMHWFNPAPIMKLIEVVRGALTSDETYNIIVDLSEKLGKIPITATDGPGFFTTRYIASWITEAIRLYEQGVANIKEIDAMSKMAFNWPMGPFELADFIGLDTLLHISTYLYNETSEAHYAAPLTLKKLVKSGFIGNPRVKVGSKGGFYEYFKVPRE
nr:3-hydroxyacyl-CoA dehydrogenase NAD-binding domain-containing protein [Candidatus Njordarchaeum guaymaensis]